MNKTICLLTCLYCLLLMVGCERVPGEETLPSDTQTITVPPETTAPPETTVPEETSVALETEDIPYLWIPDQIPEADPEIADTVIHIPELDPSGLVSATHIHFFTELCEEGPYRDGVLPICTDEQEMKSGSHYQCYAVEGGQLKKLENRTFAKEISFLEGKTYLEFQYTVNGDKVILTYEPPLYDDNGLPNYSRVLDTSRGLNECLVSLTYFTEKDEKTRFTQYFDFLNLETGELMGLFAGFDPTIFQNIPNAREFVGWTEDGDMVFYEGGSYELFDMSTKTVIEDYTYWDQGLIHTDIYVNEKSYLKVTDPLNGETVLLKTPEYWNFREMDWFRSPDGRKLMAQKYNNLLIYDGDRNIWIDIPRELPVGMWEDMCFWTNDNNILFVSYDRRNACIYRLNEE